MLSYFDDLNHFFELLPFFLCVIAYSLGSLPFAKMLNRILKISASQESRDYKIWSVKTMALILDISKGLFATFLATPSGGQFLYILLGIRDPAADAFHLPTLTLWLVGFCSILGHCFSPWQNFRGGKGVATLLGVLLILSPLSALFGIAGFLLSFFNKRILSMASIVGLLSAAIAYLVANPVQVHLWVGGAMILLILIRHEDNIDALLENREKTFR